MTAPEFDWRPATPADVPALAALYREAAARLGPAVYTPAQVAAWVAVPDDADAFRAYVLDRDTWVATAPGVGTPLGFCGVGPGAGDGDGDGDGGEPRELQSLYVHPAAMRRGLGGEMLRRTLVRAHAGGARRIAAWATPFSRPVFERAGFALVRTSVEPFGGVLFERYRVERG